MKQLIFCNNIENADNFKYFKNNAKLLGDAEAHPAPNNANGILKIATIAVPFKDLSNSWRSFKIPFINCKVELKLKRTRYSSLSANGIDNDSDNGNDNDNENSIIFSIKDTKLYVPVANL